jgi:hypothetical protein
MNYCAAAILILALASGPSTVVVRAGNYQLTEEMLDQALGYAQFLGAHDFTPTDQASLRADLIAYFKKDPAKQMEEYRVIAQNPRRWSSALALANDRYKGWQWYVDNPDSFREFQTTPFGKMVLKYNPVLLNSSGVIVTRADVDCQFYTQTLVAQAAGVSPPTDKDEEQFIHNLAWRSWFLTQEQRENLRHAEVRLADFRLVYDGSIKTRTVMIADIKASVHSPGDVARIAREAENESGYTGKYYQMFRSEELAALGHAGRVNGAVLGLGAAGRSMGRSGDINTPIGTR